METEEAALQASTSLLKDSSRLWTHTGDFSCWGLGSVQTKLIQDWFLGRLLLSGSQG